MFKLLSVSLLTSLSLYAGDATGYTDTANQKVLKTLPFNNVQDFEDIEKGFIAPLPNNGIIKNDKGGTVWDLTKYDFVKEKRPEGSTLSANPSLERQLKLLDKAGLFKVTDRIYQVRNADLSNMTIIEGKEGIIIIDPLLTKETAKAALDLYYQNRPRKPVKAVIYSHSHADHFGGVKGVISQEDVDSGKVKVFAPYGFTEAALDENIMAGNAMTRRAGYMYGSLLEPGWKGQLSAGLGLTTSTGEITLILPTDFITKTGEEREIDGVKFVFLMAPGSEAPSEMLFFLPEFKALGAAEDATHTMHNLYTLRGAKIRDARAWASYLNEAIEMFGDKTEVVFAQHHWPKWGNAQVIDFLEKQRDLYKYLNDQSLRLANQGYDMVEIGEKLELPPSLSQEWYNRGYYGSLNHNAKSVYAYYLGWFNGNPSTLHPLPEVEASKKYVEYMGGADSLLEKAAKDYDQGNYRWTAQVLNHLVYADPQNKKAKDLLANTLEQLGYQSESGPWRNFYLSGAKELRNGVQPLPMPSTTSADMVAAMPIESFFDYLAIRLNGLKAAESPMQINFKLTDPTKDYLLDIKNGVLHYTANKQSDKAAFTLTISRGDLNRLIGQQTSLEGLIKDKKASLSGDSKGVEKFLGLLDRFDPWFNIVEPVKEIKE